jgi:hypothetical protein
MIYLLSLHVVGFDGAIVASSDEHRTQRVECDRVDCVGSEVVRFNHGRLAHVPHFDYSQRITRNYGVSIKKKLKVKSTNSKVSQVTKAS